MSDKPDSTVVEYNCYDFMIMFVFLSHTDGWNLSLVQHLFETKRKSPIHCWFIEYGKLQNMDTVSYISLTAVEGTKCKNPDIL